MKPFANEPELELRRAPEREALALARAAQLEHGLVLKGRERHGAASAVGGASSCSSGTPCA